MPFRRTIKPDRLNPRLFFASIGKAKPVLIQIPGLIESVIGPLKEGTRILVVGSQARGGFRTEEDARKDTMKIIRAVTPGMRDEDREREFERAIEASTKVGTSDLDVLLYNPSAEQLAAINRRVLGNNELTELLTSRVGIDTHVFVHDRPEHNPCFDIRTQLWLGYTEE